MLAGTAPKSRSLALRRKEIYSSKMVSDFSEPIRGNNEKVHESVLFQY